MKSHSYRPTVLVFSSDPQLLAHLTYDFKTADVTAVIDLQSAIGAANKTTFDAIVVEGHRGRHQEFIDLQRAVDPARTLILAGPRSMLRHASALVEAWSKERTPATSPVDTRLENSLEGKLVDFVRSMRNGSARNLHPMVIRAIERPLISLVLQETNGNQIQAAHALGLNRNTLRKKITELRIPVKRQKAKPEASARRSSP